MTTLLPRTGMYAARTCNEADLAQADTVSQSRLGGEDLVLEFARSAHNAVDSPD